MTKTSTNYWLIKSEADCYSIDDFKKEKKASWTGVRNYQARNFMKSMRVGELALFYHSGKNAAVVGVAKVVKASHPDETQFEKKSEYFDPKATKEKPIWYLVDFRFSEKFNHPVSLADIKINPKLDGIPLAQQGSRLSVQPVSKVHFELVKKLGSI